MKRWKTAKTGCVLAVAFAIIFTGCTVHVTQLALQLPDTVVVGGSATAALVAQYDNVEASDEEKQKALNGLQIAWASSDTAVATVDNNGKVTGIAQGTATITATVQNSTLPLSAQKQIAVILPLTSIDVPQALQLVLNKTDSASLNAKPVPANASVEGTFSYLSSNTAVAAVDNNGTVTAVEKGTAVITITLDGKTATTNVTVTAEATGISLATTEGVLYVGSSYTIKASLVPAEAGEGKFSYESSNQSIATVDENGTITAKAVGTAVITVKTADGLSAEYTLTVCKKAASGTGSAVAPSTGGNGNNTGNGGAAGGSNVSSSPTMTPENCLYIGSTIPGHGCAGTCPHCGTVKGCNGFGPGHDRAGTCAGCGAVKVFENEIPASNGRPSHNHNGGGPCAVCCANYGTDSPGHGSVGQCPLCGCVNGGCVESPSDGQQGNGIEGDAW